MDRKTNGYSIKEENDEIPLKRFLLCNSCGKSMRGYIVKSKKLYYYKCCTIGCKNNRSAKWLNGHFKKILGYFNLSAEPSLTKLIREQTVATFNKFAGQQGDEWKVLKDKKKELEKKIMRLEERYINEEIDSELYYRYVKKFKQELDETDKLLAKSSKRGSNLEKCIDLAMDFSTKLAQKWDSCDYVTKQQIQKLIFPEGIFYDRKKDECRTSRINFVFLYVAHLQQVTSKKQRGIPELNLDYASFAGLVAGTGLI